MSKYMVFLYANESGMPKPGTPEFDTQNAAYGAEEAARRCTSVEGHALNDGATAKVVSVRGGKTLTTDGPFVETKEQLGGYYVLDCNDQQEASQLAATIPCAQVGTVEVRPVFEM